jgi:hypothetical protein
LSPVPLAAIASAEALLAGSDGRRRWSAVRWAAITRAWLAEKHDLRAS